MTDGRQHPRRHRDTLKPAEATAVIESLEDRVGIAARRQNSTKGLADYVIKRVEQLAKAQNASQLARGRRCNGSEHGEGALLRRHPSL
jgi:hypothetical protein